MPIDESLVDKLALEHRNWMMLHVDAKDRGLFDLAGMYGWSGIFCGRRMLHALQRLHDAEKARQEKPNADGD